MKEKIVKNGFKVISITALLLKLITIVTILAVLITVTVALVKNEKNKEEIEESQVVAEIVYTEDVKEISDLEKLENFFGLKIYDREKANKNIISITILATVIFVVEFVLLILIFDGVQKMFKNLYKTEEGLTTEKNTKIIKNIGIIAILKFIIPLITNIMTRIKLGSTVRGNVTIVQIICILIIVLISFITYYKISRKMKEEVK